MPVNDPKFPEQAGESPMPSKHSAAGPVNLPAAAAAHGVAHAVASATTYAPRIVDGELDEILPGLAAVSLEGPKGVGKTATAKRRVNSIVRLDDEEERAIASADLRLALKRTPPVLLDEWQRLPPIWDAVKTAVDNGAAPGSILLTGSAVPATTAPPTHSGAGRIVSVRMRPLSLAERALGTATVSLGALLDGGTPRVTGRTEVALADYAREIVASGFPAIRPLSPRARRAQLQGYVERIVTKEFVEQGHRVRKPEALWQWMRLYAAANATTTAFEKLRRAAGTADGAPVTHVTASAYRDILKQLWILDPLPGWAPTRSALARVAQADRHFLADPALAAHLLGLDEGALVTGGQPSALSEDQVDALRPRDGTLFGQLFEALVTLSVRVYAQALEASVSHLRLLDGRHEVDLIIQRRDQRVVAVEVKLSAVVDDNDVRHLRWLKKELGDDLLDAVVITTGAEAYRRKDGIAVVPAALLGP